MEKIRKFILPALILVIALCGSLSYLIKGDVSIIKSNTNETISSQSVSDEESSDDSGASNGADSSVATDSLVDNNNVIENQDENSIASESESPGISSDGKVNLNTANLEELQVAPGIGPSKAQAIIDYREEYGGFSCVEELTEISGIGEKTLEKIKDYYTAE